MMRAALVLALGVSGLASMCIMGDPPPYRWSDPIDLFDGKTTNGWRGFREQPMAGWQVVNGALTRVDKGPDIVTVREFADFDLLVEWKIAPGGNSGIFYRVTEEEPEMWMNAPEYQLIDDTGYRAPLKPVQKTGANYDLQAPAPGAARKAGEWNTTLISVSNARVVHSLNGVEVVRYYLWSDDWLELVSRSKFKDHPHYGRARKGRIGLQNHGDWVAFRTIRLREQLPRK
jgi:3-keto-disaccharide hydrolase